MVTDLTGLDIANASLLDEATAVAEAVALMWRGARGKAGTVVLDSELFSQSLAVTIGRAEAIGLPVVVADLTDGLPEIEGDLIGVVLQQVGASGRVRDLRGVIAQTKERGGLVTIAADLLALTLLTSPGTLGADISVGSAQRFGVPLFGGGPHAAFMAVRNGLERSLPGRLVGVSIDADGARAYRLALQTREQHIRREKATSNICTAQALLAITASMYAVYHGPDGLRAIAERVHAHAAGLAELLPGIGVERRARHLLRHDPRGRPGQGPGGRREGRRRRRQPVGSGRRPRADRLRRAHERDHLLRVVMAFAAAGTTTLESDEDGTYSFGFVGVGAPSAASSRPPRCPPACVARTRT